MLFCRVSPESLSGLKDRSYAGVFMAGFESASEIHGEASILPQNASKYASAYKTL